MESNIESMKSNSSDESKDLSVAHLSVDEAVYKLLSEYFENHPNLSLNALVNSDLKRSTLFAIMKGKGSHKLMPRTLCSLMRRLHRGKTINQISMLYDGPLGVALKNLVDDYGDNANFEYENDQIETLLENPNTYKIILLASSKIGTTLRELILELGNQCRSIVNKLLKEKSLFRKNNRFYTSSDHSNERRIVGISTTQKLAENLIHSSFWPDNFGVPKYGNALHVRVVEVNAEWYRPRALHLYKKLQEDLTELYNHPEAKGKDQQWHADAYCDLINPNSGDEEPDIDNKENQ